MWASLNDEARADIGDLHAELGARLHDYLSSELNADDADLALASTLLSAYAHADRLAEPRLLQAWLYALARAHRGLRRAAKPLTTSSWPLAATPNLVAGALASLEADHRELLDLAVRHGLTPAQIGVIFEIEPFAVDDMISQATEQFERWYAAVAAADTTDTSTGGQLPPGACRELAVLVADWRAAPMRRTRGNIRHHVNACNTCAAVPVTRSATVLLASLPLREDAPPLDHAMSEAEPLADNDELWRADGFPTVRHAPINAATETGIPVDQLTDPVDRAVDHAAGESVGQGGGAAARAGDPDADAEFWKDADDLPKGGRAFLRNFRTSPADYPAPTADDEALAHSAHEAGEAARDRAAGRGALAQRGKALLGLVAVAAVALLAFRGMQTPTVVRQAAAPGAAVDSGTALVNTPFPEDGGQEGPQEPPTIMLVPETMASPSATPPLLVTAPPTGQPVVPTSQPTQATPKRPKTKTSAPVPRGPDQPPLADTKPDQQDKPKSPDKPPSQPGQESNPPAAAQKQLPPPAAPTATISGLVLGTSRSGSLSLQCPGATCHITAASASHSQVSVSGASVSVSAPSIKPMCTDERDSTTVTVQWSGTATGDGVTTEGTTTGGGTLTATVSWTVQADKGKAYNLNGQIVYANCSQYGNPTSQEG
ncbi:hypothetical protein ACIBH1_46980 [Nonomuraea sp. NPDC050663]|uniref:hypothetical protein n=1 Tax=Nonomuraea sp. NPDC050663 TaxID=3364370 RepID=UPI0037AA130E